MSESDEPAADLPPELKNFIDGWLAEGASREEILERLKRMDRLIREEQLGLIDRVTLPDGSAEIYERDPFEHLPTTEEETDS
jgi:hypothetical protein